MNGISNNKLNWFATYQPIISWSKTIMLVTWEIQLWYLLSILSVSLIKEVVSLPSNWHHIHTTTQKIRHTHIWSSYLEERQKKMETVLSMLFKVIPYIMFSLLFKFTHDLKNDKLHIQTSFLGPTSFKLVHKTAPKQIYTQSPWIIKHLLIVLPQWCQRWGPSRETWPRIWKKTPD